MTPSNLLIAAKALIDTPDKWFKGAFIGPDGKSYCALGALYHICNAKALPSATDAINYLERAGMELHKLSSARCLWRDAMPVLWSIVPSINDEGTHADVMAMYDVAIEHALADEIAAAQAASQASRQGLVDQIMAQAIAATPAVVQTPEMESVQ